MPRTSFCSFLCALIALVPDALATEQARVCAVEYRPLVETLGSVGAFDNIRKRADSITLQSERLLRETFENRKDTLHSCPNGCGAGPHSIIYTVEPTAFLPEAEQRHECLALESETRNRPWRIATQRFKTLDDMRLWIGRFTRGNGPDGKALYQRCSSNCSPRFSFSITTELGAAFELVPEVVCGLARDKSVKHYRLATTLRTQCESDQGGSSPHRPAIDAP